MQELHIEKYDSDRHRQSHRFAPGLIGIKNCHMRRILVGEKNAKNIHNDAMPPTVSCYPFTAGGKTIDRSDQICFNRLKFFLSEKRKKKKFLHLIK